MQTERTSATIFVGLCIVAGLALLGFLLGKAAVDVKMLERTVTVKGLSEREVVANIVIWPIQFSAASNDLTALYQNMDANTAKIKAFLLEAGIAASDISVSPPSIVDKSAQQYGGYEAASFRYAATQNVTLYSTEIDKVRAVMQNLSALGKQGIVLTSGDYMAQTEYLFTELNQLKPIMIEEATRNAREVADKFAADSQSQLGKIKTAAQGQFSIYDRDRNNPHIKNVRVVATVEYYLSD